MLPRDASARAGRRSRARIAAAAVAVLLAATTAAGCAPSATGPASSHTSGSVPGIQVVAAEDFWGSIASQLGGSRFNVTSIITNPNTDPHDYEPTVADARAIADARLLILNGAGYDPWVARLAAADPGGSRTTLDVGELAGVPAGGNPHLWYSPAVVHLVVARITEDFSRLDPDGAAYYARQRAFFESTSLQHYDALVSEIRSRYAGTPIAASESIVSPLAEGLGLKVLTPAAFLAAVSEGSGPTAQDKATADAQLRSHAVRVFIYNAQNETPDVLSLIAAAHAGNVPIVRVTETMVPANGTFQDWQAAQLESLLAALSTRY